LSENLEIVIMDIKVPLALGRLEVLAGNKPVLAVLADVEDTGGVGGNRLLDVDVNKIAFLPDFSC
jgi:hypothetical protein